MISALFCADSCCSVHTSGTISVTGSMIVTSAATRSLLTRARILLSFFFVAAFLMVASALISLHCTRYKIVSSLIYFYVLAFLLTEDAVSGMMNLVPACNEIILVTCDTHLSFD